jgi:hypothetical protein
MRTLYVLCAVVVCGLLAASARACPVATSAVAVQSAPTVVQSQATVQAVQPAPVVVKSVPTVTTLAVPTVTVLETPVVASPVVVEQVVRVKERRQFRTPVRRLLFR